jgi:hypothetical protein
MKQWREVLAKDIYKNHPDMTETQLKENVQRIIDRIIFIRSCEDRGLTYGETLQEMVLQRRDDIGTAFMPTLKALFRRYDRDFDSELFDEHVCEDLAIDFTALKEIILETYDPYLFDVIIGNPPYVRIQTLPKDQVSFFSNNFVSATGNYDIYALFVERILHRFTVDSFLRIVSTLKNFLSTRLILVILKKRESTTTW